jgi:hypothetical protein
VDAPLQDEDIDKLMTPLHDGADKHSQRGAERHRSGEYPTGPFSGQEIGRS